MARVLYFAQLVDRLGRSVEDLALPSAVTDVGTLLAHLRGRGGAWEHALAPHAVRVTVNRQFATPQTAIGAGDEIAIVPSGPW